MAIDHAGPPGLRAGRLVGVPFGPVADATSKRGAFYGAAGASALALVIVIRFARSPRRSP